MSDKELYIEVEVPGEVVSLDEKTGTLLVKVKKGPVAHNKALWAKVGLASDASLSDVEWKDGKGFLLGPTKKLSLYK